MIDFLKGMVPNIFLGLGFTLELISKGFSKASTVVTHVGIQLHIIAETKLGKRFKEIEAAVKTAVETMLSIGKKLESNKPSSVRNESDQLATLVKGDKATVKLFSVGKKNDKSDS